MKASALFITLPAVALAGTHPARQFSYPADSLRLLPRTDISPSLVCGTDYVDCNNGWCCSSGETCAGELNNVPVCKDPTQTDDILGGTAVATPYQNLESVAASLSDVLATMTAVPSAGAISSAVSSALSSAASKASTTAASSGTQAAVQSATGTGAATKMNVGGFGAGVGVVGIWAVMGAAGMGFLAML